MRPATLIAGGLAVAAAGMAAAGFASRDGEPPAAARSAIRPAGAKPTSGLEVWAANGCGSCHTFAPANARGGFGPDLALSLQGADPAYIRRSIVDPRAAAAPGWDTGMMPEDFAQRIAPADLEKLVAFIRRGASGR